jgi:anti-anti-sigma regulatory factor
MSKSSTTQFAAADVSSLFTEDGVLVRLDGALDAASAPQLRSALLSSRPAGCDDVIIDAGGVTRIDDEALAILMAAGAWAVDTGARLGFSRMADCVRDEVDALELAVLLPMLAPAGERAGRPVRLAAAR